VLHFAVVYTFQTAFFCTDATELSGEFGIIAAKYSRIPGFASRPEDRSCSMTFFVIFLKSCEVL